MATTELMTLISAARMNGDADGTYRSIISQYLRGIGKKYGRERMVNLGEAMLLRLVTEAGSGNVNLKQAADDALGLLPVIEAMYSGPLSKKTDDVYAVFFWGRIGGQQKRVRYICRDQKHLLTCIKEMTGGGDGWPNVRIIDLNRLYNETVCGWTLATQGIENGKTLILSTLTDADPPKYREAMNALVKEMERRLRGARRVDASANDDWKHWPPKADVA